MARPRVSAAAGGFRRRTDCLGALAGPGGTIAGGESDGITVHEAVSLDRLEATQTVDDRIGAVRGFTRDNPARAALAIRDMIKADAK